MLDKIKRIVRINYKWIICFVCLVLFLALAEDVFNHEIMNGDIVGYKFISTYLIHDSVTPIFKIIIGLVGLFISLNFFIVIKK